MMSPGSTPLALTLRRHEPEFVRPAKPTPREFKMLSDIDDQDTLRTQVPQIQFYEYNPSMKEKDPAKVIKDALMEVLVFYYPFAGRLKEGPNRKLMVDCNSEGALFIEGDTDVTLEQFDELQPPFPCLDELIYDIPGSGNLNSPLLLIQVTRLKCGGFIFASRANHTVADAAGVFQMISAMAEIARGVVFPSILPVWERHLLTARSPPKITCDHRQYDKLNDLQHTITPSENMIHRSFFFRRSHISAIRRFLPPHLQHSSTFEVLTACLWRCRTLALQFNPNEEVRLIFIVDIRSKLDPPLPTGYYGNAIVHPAAITTVGKLCENTFGYAVELVKQTKESVTEEYVRSVVDFLSTNGKPPLNLIRTYWVSKLPWQTKFSDLDFGWGKAIYGGPAKGTVASFQIPHRNKKGEEGVLVPMFLPASAMERFVEELSLMVQYGSTGSPSNSAIKSTL